jgi:fimbrial chaperone protein
VVTNNHREKTSMASRTFIARVIAGATAVALGAPCFAGTFSVTPVRIFATPRDRAIAVTVSNDGDEELVMQADIYSWKQKPNGEDELVLSDDLVLSPPILKLAPKSRQVVRLALVGAPKSEQQLTYRMVTREVPEARPGADTVQLQIALAFSIPVFITPPKLKSALECTASRAGPETASVSCANTGTAYAQARDVALITPAGEKVAQRDLAAYLLPSVKRSFELKAASALKAGSYKLAVGLDDGTTSTYDVTLRE